MARQPAAGRDVLPVPDAHQPYPGLVTYDAKDSATSFAPTREVRPPTGAPNVLIMLLDDVGFAASRVDTSAVTAGVNTSSDTGSPAMVMSDRAEGADPLVLDPEGAGSFAALLLGSVSQQVSPHEPCPVVIATDPSFTRRRS